MQKTYRIGQIVPSSNTTMETEIPAMLLARQAVRPERFTFHSSRMRMKKVVKEELAAMDAESDRCALELSDARVDVLGYACLVAIMAMGHGYHRVSQERLHGRTVENGGAAPVITSAGALVDALKVMGQEDRGGGALHAAADAAGGRLYPERGHEVVVLAGARDPGQPGSGRHDPRACRASCGDGSSAASMPSCCRRACRCRRCRRWRRLRR